MIKKVLAGAVIASQLIATAVSAAPVRPQAVSFTGPRLSAPAIAPVRASTAVKKESDLLGGLLIPVIIGGVITFVVVAIVVLKKGNPSTVK